jgi:acyl-CoA thioester hydrolase
MTTEFDLTKRETFKVFEPEKIRFSDTDMIGHVNNVAFAALLESGRTAFGQANLFPHMPDGVLVVMARVEIDYRRELHWPLTVDVGTRIIAIGRSSYVMGQGIFRGDTCATTGRTTLVMIDRKTRRSHAFPDSYRTVLENLLTS